MHLIIWCQYAHLHTLPSGILSLCCFSPFSWITSNTMKATQTKPNVMRNKRTETVFSAFFRVVEMWFYMMSSIHPKAAGRRMQIQSNHKQSIRIKRNNEKWKKNNSHHSIEWKLFSCMVDMADLEGNKNISYWMILLISQFTMSVNSILCFLTFDCVSHSNIFDFSWLNVDIVDIFDSVLDYIVMRRDWWAVQCTINT